MELIDKIKRENRLLESRGQANHIAHQAKEKIKEKINRNI